MKTALRYVLVPRAPEHGKQLYGTKRVRGRGDRAAKRLTTNGNKGIISPLDAAKGGEHAAFYLHLAVSESANESTDDGECRYTSISLVSKTSIHRNSSALIPCL